MKRSAMTMSGGKRGGGDAAPAGAGVAEDFPSLAAVRELNAMSSLNKTIRINDRNGVPLAALKTVHTSVALSSINDILLKSLIAAEDARFYDRSKAYDCNALLRSILRAAFESLYRLKPRPPRGCSTIQMQVARFLLMRYDGRGFAYTEKSIARKLNELKLAQALGMTYTKEELLTFYVNHCVSAGRGMVGYHDISVGLFGVPPDKLTVPQSLYLARLVKWNRQVPRKIIQQIKASLPAFAASFGWSAAERKRVTRLLDSLTFLQPRPLIPANGYLIDCANDFLRDICRRRGMTGGDLDDLDIADPESRIRLFGNAVITLTIDYRLQKLLERVVSGRGFAPDTAQGAKRQAGQYFAYAIMDSRTHRLLAYCSTDRLGSRLRSLLVNRYPNGSSVAKPLIFALAYDREVYAPTEMASDEVEIPDTCAWTRKLLYDARKEPAGMVYLNVPEKGGYAVRNHDRKFDGYDFMFNHLANSNNIMAIETMYRLTTDLSADNARAREMNALARRLGVRDNRAARNISGPRLYAGLVSVVRDSGVDCDKFARNYSTALGTLELSLYEQMHLFNALYDTALVLAPARHPSLFVKSVRLGGEEVRFADTVRTVPLFTDPAKIRPVLLALHKRLVSNPADGLDGYDICGDASRLSNFAKSGTTDDVIRPFDADGADTARTNYGLWNAVLRLKLKREDLRGMADGDTLFRDLREPPPRFDAVPAEEELDVTLACIGECNKRYTGDRDGKSLHGFVSRELLRAFGVPCAGGFYTSYESELIGKTSDKVKYAGCEPSNLGFLSRAFIKLRTSIGAKATSDEVVFEASPDGEIRLAGKSRKKMLEFALHLGESSRAYRDFLDSIERFEDTKAARDVLARISALEAGNKFVQRDLQRACGSLLKSLGEIEAARRASGKRR
jgi:membrane peptidoglycan carboxypeptidase